MVVLQYVQYTYIGTEAIHSLTRWCLPLTCSLMMSSQTSRRLARQLFSRRRGEDGADAPCPDRSRNRDGIEREVEQSRKRGREEARSSGTGGGGARHGGGAIGGAAAAVKVAAAAAAVRVLGFRSGSDRNLA